MVSPQEHDMFPEHELSPENIVGSDFKIASIVGRGSGHGYEVDGLALPRGWQEGVSRMHDPAFWERLRKIHAMQTEELGMRGEVVGDPKTGILRRVSVTTPSGREGISLDDTFLRGERGEYRAATITTAAASIALHATVARYLSAIRYDMGEETEYAYIERASGGGYYSQGLILPDRISSVGPVMNDFTLRKFENQAHNIAGRFGQEIKHLQFDENSVLQSVTVLHGNATMYYLERSMGRELYVPHNVDTADQALTLHGITAAYINRVNS